MVKVWARHWVTLNSRPLSRRSETEMPVLLVSLERNTLGLHVPEIAKTEFRHYMSNIFIYLMPPEEEDTAPMTSPVKPKGLVHGWEVKIGMPVEEAKQFAAELLETIDFCEKRREERHKQQIREE